MKPVPKARGVGRDVDDKSGRTIFVYFEREISDDELRTVHETLAGRGDFAGIATALEAAKQADETGISVVVSRQATEEAAAILRVLSISTIEDAALLDYLEAEANREPLVLHDGNITGVPASQTKTHGLRGLGLRGIGRSLRRALTDMRGAFGGELQLRSSCPDCGRLKALTADQAAAGDCPKWHAVRDREAAEDCVDFAKRKPS